MVLNNTGWGRIKPLSLLRNGVKKYIPPKRWVSQIIDFMSKEKHALSIVTAQSMEKLEHTIEMFLGISNIPSFCQNGSFLLNTVFLFHLT